MLPALIAAGMVMAVASSGQDPLAPVATAPAGAVAAAEQVYLGLFSSTEQPGQAPLPRFRFRVPDQVPSSRPGPRRKVVCGMTLVLTDPRADAAMVKPKPDSGIDYAIRRVPPPMCGKDGK